MKYHAVVFVSLIALPSIFSTCFGHENPDASEVANATAEIQQPDAAEATIASPEVQQPTAAMEANVSPEDQNPGTSKATNDNPRLEKPNEAEAIEAAIAYLNRDGQKIIQKSEFIAWGTYSEKLHYWPMKLRLTYKTKGYDTPRQNDYAVKISKDIDGKLKAAQYYAWRTDFK